MAGEPAIVLGSCETGQTNRGIVRLPRRRVSCFPLFVPVLIFLRRSPPNNTPPPFIYPPRLAADPVQEDAIWSRVLYFLSRSAPLFGWRCEWKPAPLAPILVCKKFMVGYSIACCLLFIAALATRPPTFLHESLFTRFRATVICRPSVPASSSRQTRSSAYNQARRQLGLV
jgi:hypothetical protein